VVRNFRAKITLRQSLELKIEPNRDDLNTFNNIRHLSDRVKLHGYYGGERLIKACVKKFFDYCEENEIKLEEKNFTVSYSTTIPRQVGLGGSSAIITALMRALSEFYNIEISIDVLPGLILRAETEELDVTAGLQDRVVQVHEGCMYMDFDRKFMEKNGRGVYEAIDPSLLPNLYIAYKTELGKVSGRVLNTIRTRFDNNDKYVIGTLDKIASLAEQGVEALRNNNHEKLNELMNENFDLRASIMDISRSNMELVNVARSCGASAKFTGSGGSIIGIIQNQQELSTLIDKMKDIGAEVIEPKSV